MNLADSSHPFFNATISFLVLFSLAFLVLRWGLLSLCAEVLFTNLIYVSEARTSAWYFGGTACILVLAVMMAVWAFHTSIGSRKLWKEDFLG